MKVKEWTREFPRRILYHFNLNLAVRTIFNVSECDILLGNHFLVFFALSFGHSNCNVHLISSSSLSKPSDAFDQIISFNYCWKFELKKNLIYSNFMIKIQTIMIYSHVYHVTSQWFELAFHVQTYFNLSVTYNFCMVYLE